MTDFIPNRRAFMALAGSAALGACTTTPPVSIASVREQFIEGYGPVFDSGYELPGIPSSYLDPPNRRATGQYLGEQSPGTIDVDPYAKFLYLVREGNNSVRFPVGVGRAGRSFRGQGNIQLKRKWPGWTPTANMLRTEPDVYGPFARGIPGGLRSPLGARALYLYKGGRDTYYRIHGTNDLQSIGNSGSAGCIRLFNQDIIALYDMIDIGTQVHVRGEEESLRVDPENFNRGIELPATRVDPNEVYGAAARANDHPPIFDDPRDGLSPGQVEAQSDVPL